MSYCEETDIAYTAHTTDDPRRQFDLYFKTGAQPRPLICFIHGGAWRTEDKQQHAGLARRLLAATGCPVAVPNYRLTPPENDDPRFRHPLHAEDICAFLHFVIDSSTVDASRLVLIGHSCSAHMLASIFLDSRQSTLVPLPRVLGAIKGIIMSEGIYDLDTLLASFPAYRGWFIQPAFGPADSYRQLSVLNYPLRPTSSIQWLLLHSKGDTLIDIAQTMAMHDHLQDLDPQNIKINVDDLLEEHDEILQTETYVNIINQFVTSFA